MSLPSGCAWGPGRPAGCRRGDHRPAAGRAGAGGARRRESAAGAGVGNRGLASRREPAAVEDRPADRLDARHAGSVRPQQPADRLADLDHMYTFRPRQQPRLARLVVQRPEFHEAIRGLAALVPLSTDEVVGPVVRMWVRPDQSDLEWLERIVAPVAQRAAARVNAIAEVGCLPGFTRSQTTEPITFSAPSKRSTSRYSTAAHRMTSRSGRTPPRCLTGCTSASRPPHFAFKGQRVAVRDRSWAAPRSRPPWTSGGGARPRRGPRGADCSAQGASWCGGGRRCGAGARLGVEPGSCDPSGDRGGRLGALLGAAQSPRRAVARLFVHGFQRAVVASQVRKPELASHAVVIRGRIAARRFGLHHPLAQHTCFAGTRRWLLDAGVTKFNTDPTAEITSREDGDTVLEGVEALRGLWVTRTTRSIRSRSLG